jgi:hypothetical protein
MKIKELSDALPTLSVEDRAEAVAALWPHLCKISQMDLLSQREAWDYSRPFEEFQKAQNKVICGCLAMELSAFGEVVRKMLGMEKLDPEIELLPEAAK